MDVMLYLNIFLFKNCRKEFFSVIFFFSITFIETKSFNVIKNGSATANNLQEVIKTLKYEIKPIIQKQVGFQNFNEKKKNPLIYNLMNFNKRSQRNSELPLKFMKNVKEYKIFITEFHRVETPFIIGIWIFFASVAKIGKRFSV